MDKGEKVISLRLRGALLQFPLYEYGHWVQTVMRDDNVHISYAPSWERYKELESTRFDVQISGEVCYILDFNIEKDRRDQGFGTQLLEIIERFCLEEFGCRRFVTTPSGNAKESHWWENRGYSYFNKREAEKVV